MQLSKKLLCSVLTTCGMRLFCMQLMLPLSDQLATTCCRVGSSAVSQQLVEAVAVRVACCPLKLLASIERVSRTSCVLHSSDAAMWQFAKKVPDILFTFFYLWSHNAFENAANCMRSAKNTLAPLRKTIKYKLSQCCIQSPVSLGLACWNNRRVIFIYLNYFSFLRLYRRSE